MRNENLKNRLNELPQDFDQDQLWNAIDLPKKKKRKRGFFWIVGGLVVLLGILVFSSIYISKIDSNEGIVQENQKMEEQADQKLDVQKNRIEEQKIIENSKIDLNNTIEQQKIEQKNIAKINLENVKSTLKNTILDSSIPEKVIVKKQNSSDSLIKEESHSNNIKHIEKNDLNSETFASKTILPSIELDSDMAENKGSGVIDINRNDVQTNIDHLNSGLKDELKSFADISLPLLLPIESMNVANIEDNLSITKAQIQSPYPFKLSVFSLVGRSNHTFERVRDLHPRSDNEKPLESISAGILGHFEIGNLDLFSGVAYSRMNTHFTYTDKENVTLNSLEGPTKRIVTTQYSLYNSYQYIDLLIGLGYRLELSQKWSLTPSIQMGYSMNTIPDGDIFSEELGLQRLGDLEEYQNYSKWQGQANLKLTRKLNDYWEIGIIGYLNTQKTLAAFEDYTHKASSQGIGLSVGRLF